MNFRRISALLGLAAAAIAVRAEPAEREQNVWPVSVRYQDPAAPAGARESWTAAGPLIFRKPNADADGNTASGFRPFWVQLHNPQGEFRAGYFLYPLFSYSVDENTYKWSVFELIRRTDRRASAAPPKSVFEQNGEFEVFPFWFSRETGDGELNYKALFPVYGTIKNKLGFERLSWTIFPLYVENEKRGAITSTALWPIFRRTHGAAHGWGVWPLFNYVDRPGVSRYETYLWPLGFNATRYPSPDDPPGTPPRRDVGFLPFYARNTGPGYINEDYAWPFFGYTERTLPKRYREHRYLWPFFVQGRGDEHYINRWAPFYTHSINKGVDKHWYAWPLVRHARWDDEGIARERSQFLYFVYWNERQRAAGRANSPTAALTHLWPLYSNRWAPFYTHSINKGVDKHWYAWPLVRHARWDDEGIARERSQFLYFVYWNERQRAAGRANSPTAALTHLWPLYSNWDNGAGRRQWQFFSPFDVFFPSNEKVRQAWSPIFAIARYDRRAPGDARTSLLWNFVSWEKHTAEERSEFHVGPIFSMAREAEAKRVAIGNGLFGFRRPAGGGWRMFWWDFPRKADSNPPSSR